MTRIITAEDAINALREVVKEAGADYVDPNSCSVDYDATCVYIDEGGHSSCIVGRAFEKMGHKFPRNYNQTVRELFSYSTVAGHWRSPVGKFSGVVLTTGALELLSAAQSAQDFAESWSTAVYEAECVYIRRGNK